MIINTRAYGNIDLPAQRLYGRMLVVQSDLDVMRKNARGAAVSDLIREGELFLPRWERETQTVRYVHFRSIFDLCRACVYMLGQWGSFEVGELGQIGDDLDHVSWIMHRLIGHGALSPTVRKHVVRMFVELHGSLKSKSDPDKARARELIRRASGLVDALGRVNPLATHQRLAAAQTHLIARSEAVDQMRPSIARRDETLRVETDGCANVLWHVRNRLGDILKHGGVRRGTVLATENAALRRDLLALAGETRSLRVQPFLAMRAFTVSDLEKAAGMLHARFYADALITLTNAYNGARSKLAAIWLEPHHTELGILVREARLTRTDTNGERVRRYRTRIDRLVADLTKFRDQLGLLDDTGFVRPIFKKVQVKLDKAIPLLEESFFDQAKEQVKSASALL